VGRAILKTDDIPGMAAQESFLAQVSHFLSKFA